MCRGVARNSLAHNAVADNYREEIVRCWGRRALVSLAFVITAANLPNIEYALGHGKACMRVLGDFRLWPDSGAV